MSHTIDRVCKSDSRQEKYETDGFVQFVGEPTQAKPKKKSSTHHNSTKAVSNEVRRRIYDDWFADKRYISLLVFKKACPMSHHERLIYSFVTWLHRLDPEQSKPYTQIAARLSISENSVSAAAKSLEKRGLIAIGIGRSNRAVLRLTDQTPDWLVIGSQGAPASNRLYQLADTNDSPFRMTSLDVALLASLYGLAIQRGTLLIENSKSGLAKMITASSKKVRSSLLKFGELGLAKWSGNEVALLRPPTATLRLFADCGTDNQESTSPGILFQLEVDGVLGNRLNEQLRTAQLRQWEAGWKDQQPFEFWNSIFRDSLKGLDLKDRLSLLEDFLVERLPALWLSAEEQHQETGRAGNNRFLLTEMAHDSVARLRKERGYA